MPSTDNATSRVTGESQEPEIQKPERMLREGDVMQLYENFREEIEKIRQEEERNKAIAKSVLRTE